MKMKGFSYLVVFYLVFVSVSSASQMTQIEYTAEDLGSGRWLYSYEVQNIGLTDGIEEFAIWFDYCLYEDLLVTIPFSPANDWDEIVIQPEPVLGDDGFYDALTLDLPINISETASMFSVSFDWLGIEEPSSQYYEIIDPVTFGTIESGYTVPEPATCLLLLSGAVLLRRRKIQELQGPARK